MGLETNYVSSHDVFDVYSLLYICAVVPCPFLSEFNMFRKVVK